MNKPQTHIHITELTIGRLARAAGVNVETIRYYQRIGLIAQPHTPAQGFRKYPEHTIKTLTFIKRAQRLGFSLKEIHELLELGKGSCDDVRKRAEKRRDKIELQIKDLRALSDTLNQLIDECKHDNNSESCPIVSSLQTPDRDADGAS